MVPSPRLARFRRTERTEPLPVAVRDAANLPRGDKLLAHCSLERGGWALATASALVLVSGADVPERTARFAWHDVAEASWEPETSFVTISWADTSRPAVTVHLGERPGRVPEVLRERVMSTYVLSQRVVVRGRRGVTVAVRRHADDGTLFTQTVPDDGIDLTRTETAAKVQALVQDLSEQVGLRR